MLYLGRSVFASYKPPRANKHETASFNLIVIWSFQMLYIGRIRIAISAKMFGAELARKKVRELIHFPESWEPILQ